MTELEILIKEYVTTPHSCWQQRLTVEARIYKLCNSPPLDVVSYAAVHGMDKHRRPEISVSSSNNWNRDGRPAYPRAANVKFTFCGDTGVLKNVEMLT